MNKLLFSAALLSALTGALLFAADKPTDAAKKKSPTSTTRPTTRPVAINKICPVDGNNPVDPSVTTVIYNDQVIGFCCEDCVPKFRDRPDWYVRDLK